MYVLTWLLESTPHLCEKILMLTHAGWHEFLSSVKISIYFFGVCVAPVLPAHLSCTLSQCCCCWRYALSGAAQRNSDASLMLSCTLSKVDLISPSVTFWFFSHKKLIVCSQCYYRNPQCIEQERSHGSTLILNVRCDGNCWCGCREC